MVHYTIIYHKDFCFLGKNTILNSFSHSLVNMFVYTLLVWGMVWKVLHPLYDTFKKKILMENIIQYTMSLVWNNIFAQHHKIYFVSRMVNTEGRSHIKVLFLLLLFYMIFLLTITERKVLVYPTTISILSSMRSLVKPWSAYTSYMSL